MGGGGFEGRQRCNYPLGCKVVLDQEIHQLLDGKAEKRDLHDFVGRGLRGVFGAGVLDAVEHAMSKHWQGLEHGVEGRQRDVRGALFGASGGQRLVLQLLVVDVKHHAEHLEDG